MTATTTDRTARQGVVVVVPTTDQPILLKRLSLLPKIPTSRVVLGNETSDQCEGWTRDYNNMLRPDAPARALLGLPEAGGYRLVVGADIDHGKSWMMPVLAAHAATARDLPVVDRLGQARALIWTTGAVNLSYADTIDAAGVIDDDYHLKSKIDRSRTLFADAAHAGAPVICLLPDAPGAKEAATWAGAILKGQPHHVRIVRGLAGAIAAIEAFARRGEIADLDEPEPPAAAPEPPASAGRGLMPLAARPDEKAQQDPKAEPPPAQTAGPTVEAVAPPSEKPSPAPGPASAPGPATAPSPAAAGASRPAASAAPAAAPSEALAKVAADLANAAKAEAAGRAAAAQAPKPAGFPGGMAAVIGVGIAVAVGALAYMALYPAPPTPAQRPAQQAAAPATSQPVATGPTTPTATTPASPPPVTVAPAGAAARIGLLRPPAGRSCQALVMDMSPRYEEGELLIAPGQAGLELDRSTVCGVTIAGLNQVSARFAPLGRDVIVPSLSVGNRLIFNPASSAGGALTVELSGAQTGQVVLTLR